MHFAPLAIPGSQPYAVGDSFPQLRAQTPAHAGSPIHDQPAHCLVVAGGSEVLDPNPSSLSSARLWVELRKIPQTSPPNSLCWDKQERSLFDSASSQYFVITI